FVDGEDFNEIGTAFENACPIHKASLGNGTIRLMKQRDLVDFAVRWIEENRK
ncbi:MAG: AAC(3) family N-acetyltransferase, partial [Oscillospiraceae bacterium]|nr:AAC(3) family N-acetyltransferase [Oscillospiraceae bacterium]